MDLRGASAEALVALTEELAGHTADASAATQVSADLFDLAQTLRREGALRRFATDASVPVAAKQGLVAEVFGPRFGAGAVAVLTAAVARRWTVTRDLADVLEHLSVVATVTSAGTESGRLVDELFSVGQTIKTTPELRDALSDPARSEADKATLVSSLLEGKALPATVTLAVRALAGTYRTVLAALAAYEKVAAQVHGQSVATIRAARPLSEAELGRLGGALSAQYGRPVHLNLVVDPTVLGGLRVEIGDDVIDGTVSSRLDDARRRLVG